MRNIFTTPDSRTDKADNRQKKFPLYTVVQQVNLSTEGARWYIRATFHYMTPKGPKPTGDIRLIGNTRDDGSWQTKYYYNREEAQQAADKLAADHSWADVT